MTTPRTLTANTTYAQPELRDQDGELVAVGTAYQHQTAMRLAACWNACDGISTANLQQNLPVKELAERYNATLRERDQLLEALRETWRVIDAAGLINLSNGVQLGPTVWFVKANDARELSMKAIEAASPEPAELQPASRITVTNVCGANEEKCNWVETQPFGSRCTTCGLTIPF